jgi:hypothetical protein
VALIAVVLALATSAIKAMLGHREEGASVTTDVARGEHERYAGRAAPDRAGPPGQELPSAGTGQLNQIAASATHPPNSPPAMVASGKGFYRYPNTAFDQPGFI